MTIEQLSETGNSPNTFYSTREAANLLGRAEITLRKWRQFDRGPKYEKCAGGFCRYLGKWLIDWQQQHIVEPGA